MLTRRQFLLGTLALAATGTTLAAYAWRIEPHWLRIDERALPIAGLPPTLDGATLVHLSDLHVGPQVADDYILDTFRRVSALRPDIVVVTGDFTSQQADVVEHVRRIYAHVPHGRLATLGVLGNHDYGLGHSEQGDAPTTDRLAAALADSGVTVLRNEVANVAGLSIIGMDELWAGRFDPVSALSTVPVGGPMLALIHNPDCADQPGWDGFSGWILAGHTHGGQVKAPFLPPPLLPAKNRRYVAGEYDLTANRRMFISRGVGHLQRVRFDVRPEVTAFTLRRG